MNKTSVMEYYLVRSYGGSEFGSDRHEVCLYFLCQFQMGRDTLSAALYLIRIYKYAQLNWTLPQGCVLIPEQSANKHEFCAVTFWLENTIFTLHTEVLWTQVIILSCAEPHKRRVQINS